MRFQLIINRYTVLVPLSFLLFPFALYDFVMYDISCESYTSEYLVI